MSIRHACVLVALLLAQLSCRTTALQDPSACDLACPAGSVCYAPSPDEEPTCRLTLEDRCTTGTSWQPGLVAFDEATGRAGFEALGVTGTRVAVADYDGDGWPDLVVRRAGFAEDDFGDGGSRAVWLLRNRGDGTFEDTTRASGLVARRGAPGSPKGRPAEVVAFADVDNDGHLDVVTLFSTVNVEERPSQGAEIMLGDGTGGFVHGPVSEPLHMNGQLTSRTAAAFVDVDRDGAIDLWVGQGSLPVTGPAQDLLLFGDGTGAFIDGTQAAGLRTKMWTNPADLDAARGHSNNWSVAACDLDGDGTPELLASSYGRAPNHLWRGVRDERGAVTYLNHSIASGYAFDHRTDWSDNESARCYCKLNPGAQDCDGVPVPEYFPCERPEHVFRWDHALDRNPFRLGGNSGTTVCADLDGDGHLDLLTSEIVHWDVGSSSDPSEILYNRGEGDELRFERPGNEATGLVRERTTFDWDDGDITAAVFDFDNDGRPDILIASTDYPGTRALLFHQREDGRFEPVPIEPGIDLTSAHGIGVADFDGDGDLDLVLSHSRMRCDRGDHCLEKNHVRLFDNVIGQDGNWIQLDLEGGPGTNRAAIGTRVRVETDERVQVQEVGGGHGHYGMQHDLRLHFGLGSACEARVTVRWPDAALSEQSFTLQTGYRYALRQGELVRVAQ